MVSGLGYPLIVTPVMKVNGPTRKDSGGVRQHHADLVQHPPLLAGHDQKLESAVQAVAITHHGSHLHNVRRDGDGKLEGNNFAGLQLTAEGRPDAVLAEFAGSAPARGRQTFAKYRHLNARVETITGGTPHPPLSFGCRFCVAAQSSFSTSDLSLKSPLRLCFSARVALNGIKVHVPTITRIAAWGGERFGGEVGGQCNRDVTPIINRTS